MLKVYFGKRVGTGIGLAAAFLSSSLALSVPNTAYIKDFTYGGAGCPGGSVGYLFSDDRTILELLFDSFQANLQPVGWGAPAYPSQNACSVSFKLAIPPGWSASWHQVEHRGFADTTGGAYGQLISRYYIPGAGGFDANRVYNFAPGLVQNYLVVQSNISTAWTPCGSSVPMTVNTRVRLSGNPTGYNALTVDSISKKVKTILRFAWHSCQ